MGRGTEVRWFIRGVLPAGLPAWFAPRAQPAPERPREDRYLVIPGNHVAGVKLRKGKYEVKIRTGAPREASWGGVAGRIEEWDKWLDGAPEGPAANPELRQIFARHGLPLEGAWRGVRKTRVMGRVALDGTRWIEPTVFEYFPTGARAEYAALELEVPGGPHAPWWTLAFEAFGSPTPHETLIDAVHAFLARRAPLPELRAEDSMGYPEWLARVG